MLTNNLDKIRMVLVETSHPGNIGAAARAMKTMMLSKLYLVKPKMFPHADATARAAGADDLLTNAVVTDSLDQALANCNIVIGTSARLRTLPIPLLEPKATAEKIRDFLINGNNEIAIIFGRENSGLNNEELMRCNYHINIPTNPDFSSLNLGSAVQIIAYEINMACSQQINISNKNTEKNNDFELATADEIELFYQHLEKVLTDIGFLIPHQSTKLMLKLRRLFNRAQLEKNEINILRGMLTEIQKQLRIKN